LADFDRWLELEYNVAQTHTWRAVAYLYLDMPEAALEALAAAERAGTLGSYGLHLLAEAHRFAGHFGPAAEVAERLRLDDPGTAAHHDAMLISRTEGLERAQDAWRASERLYPYDDARGAPTRAEIGELT
ncbi:hypothetical protein, partial [Cellulomonas iranensis]|uniref:hypothetical protein n=1 Tax=Cellulomonas iranensis TaxID=76862 RepID=UPI001C4E3FE8